LKAIRPRHLERVIVDTTVQEKPVAHPTDSRLLDVCRQKLVAAADRYGIRLRQSYARKGPEYTRRAVEPVIGHLKAEGRMRRNHLRGQLGDALNVVLAAAGYNLRWLMRWLILFCARFRGGQVPTLLLRWLMELLLGVSTALSRGLPRPIG